MAFIRSRTSSSLLSLILLLLSFSHCLAHYCKCECNMANHNKIGRGSSDSGFVSGSGSISGSGSGSGSAGSGSISAGSGSGSAGSGSAGSGSISAGSGSGSAGSGSAGSGSISAGSGSGSAGSGSAGSGSISAGSGSAGSGSAGSGSISAGSGSAGSGSISAGSDSGSGSAGSGSGSGSSSGSGSAGSGSAGSGSVGSGSGSGSGSISAGSGSGSGSAGSAGSGSGSISGHGSVSGSGSGSGSGSSTSSPAPAPAPGPSNTPTQQSPPSSSSNAGGSSSGQMSSTSTSNSGHQSASGSGTGSTSSQSSISGSGQISLQFGFNASFPHIVAFGDSFTDTGNSGILGGLMAFANALKPGSPYGSSFPHQPNQPATRFCDGRLLIDFLAEAFHLPLLQPSKNTSADFSKGINFAVGGSTVFPGKFFENNSVGRTLMWKLVPDCIRNQLDWFQQFLHNVHCKNLDVVQCKLKVAKSLFWVGEMAFNDYLRNFGGSITVQTLMEKIIDFKFSLLKNLLDNGAKYIVIQGLPPLGCFPLHMSISPSGDRDETGCVRSANSICKSQNDLLLKKIGELRAQYPPCHIIYADFFNAFLTILKSPAQYGFQETFKSCCGSGAGLFNFNLHCLCGAAGSSKCQDPSKYISWDGMHLTEAMNSKLAQLFFNENFCQPAFKQTISAVGQV